MRNLGVGGSWAGGQYAAADCPGNCIGELQLSFKRIISNNRVVDYVNANASAFSDAYWDIASLKIYLPDDGSNTTGTNSTY